MISIIDIFHDVWSITKGVFTSFLGSHLSTLLAQQLIMRALRDLAPVSTVPRKLSALPASPALPAPAPIFNDPFAADAPPTAAKVHRDLTIAKVSYTPAPLMIFLLGAPGTGKGTQCAHLEEAFPCLTTLSFGDTLREFRVKDHPWVDPFEDQPSSHTPQLPDDLAAHLLWQHIEPQMNPQNPKPKLVWLIDGFPRRPLHLQAWLKLFPAPAMVIHLYASKENSARRVKKRSFFSGRPEDANSVRANQRIEQSHDNMPGLVGELKKAGLDVIGVDGNRPIEVVSQEMDGLVSAALKKWVDENPEVKDMVDLDAKAPDVCRGSDNQSSVDILFNRS